LKELDQVKMLAHRTLSYVRRDGEGIVAPWISVVKIEYMKMKKKYEDDLSPKIL